MITVRRVRFKGADYILVGTEDGSITTETGFRAGAKAFAYLTPAGDVYRDGEVVGSRSDVYFGEVENWPAFKYPPAVN